MEANSLAVAPTLAVVNPLAAALRHYETQVMETLQRIGRDGVPLQASAPIDSDRSLAARSAAHLRLTRRASRSAGPALVLWPGFGYYDPALWRAAGARATVLIHDPTPLRRQHGTSWASRRAGRWGARGQRIQLACHTREAALATAQLLDIAPPPVLLHPIRTAPPAPSAPPAPGAAPAPSADATVVVAGQFKPERDLDLIAALGPALSRRGIRGRLVGRGWPEVRGWERRSGFLSEAEFLGEIEAADAVLLPYRRYWQSGVAIQALESSTPVVGYRTEFLSQLFGDEHGGFVSSPDPADWAERIDQTIAESDGAQVRALRIAYEKKVDQSWHVLARA